MDRRRLLGLGGRTAAALAAAGCAPVGPAGERAFCTTRSELVSRRSLGGSPLVYEVDARPSRFFFEPAFLRQLEAWLAFHRYSAAGGPVNAIRTYGSWVDGGDSCDSWHNSGRAFDLAALSRQEGTVSLRYDRWRTSRLPELTAARRSYWQVAAGLHLHFGTVLTYLYDASHANHIHVDNGRSGQELSTFRSGSRAQVQAVQAMAAYVWDQPVEVTGSWDAQTRRATQTVLGRTGTAGELTDSTERWHAFLRASVAGRI